MQEVNFKHTEIGLIPYDWEVKELGQLCKVNGRVGFRGYNKSDLVPRGMGAYTIGCKHISKNRLDLSDPEYISWRKYYESPEIMVKMGDILLAQRGTLGVSAIVSKDIGPATINPSLVLLNKIQCNNLFLSYYLKTKESIDEVSQNASLTSIPMISQKQIELLRVILPPTTTEQERIADALSKIDNLITDLDALIEKKRAIKTGTMQQLLTGKKRLKGYSGEWVRVTFEDVISRFATGLNPRNNFVLNDGGFLYYVTIKDFKDGVLYFESCDRINEVAFELIQKRADLKKGDLLFSSIGRVGDAYVIKEDPKDWNINESVYNLRPNYDKITSDFLYFMIKSKDVSNKLQEAVTGSTLRSIKMSHLKQISFFIPPTIDEQNAIASILSSMDTEIAALEQKRDKYIAIKQGMMQNLLTGKIRLV